MDGRAKASKSGIRVLGGVPTAGIELVLESTVRVSGRIDMTIFGDTRPQQIWLSFQRDTGNSNGVSVEEDGTFVSDDLVPGTYKVTINYWRRQPSIGDIIHKGEIAVGPNGVENLLILPEKKPTPPEKTDKEGNSRRLTNRLPR